MFILDAERKLAFVGKSGFDIFGNNALFTPLVKWETLQNYVNGIKDAAEIYENAFNDVLQQVTDNENFEQLSDIKNNNKINIALCKESGNVFNTVWNPESRDFEIQYLKSGIHGMGSGIQGCLEFP